MSGLSIKKRGYLQPPFFNTNLFIDIFSLSEVIRKTLYFFKSDNKRCSYV